MHIGKRTWEPITRWEVVSFVVYLLLLLPPSFFGGITHEDKRTVAYLRIAIAIGSLLVLLAMHMAGLSFPAYLAFYRRRKKLFTAVTRGLMAASFLVLAGLFAVVSVPIWFGIDPFSFSPRLWLTVIRCG